MSIESVIFFDLVITVFILVVALIAVGYYFWHYVKKVNGKINITGNDAEKNADPLAQAREKAIKMIDEANNKALDIISKATLSTDTVSETFKQEMSHTSSIQVKEFKKATSDFTKVYFQILQDLKIKNIEAFQNVSKDIEINTTKEITNFKESMEKLTTLSQNEAKKKIDADYTVLKKEMEDYKNQELQKVEEGIYELLENVSKLVLGKALSLSEHEELIEKSLKEAKKEGIFK
jgi:hypothetical protein